MKDLIERQKAIEALCSDCQGRCIPCESYPCSEVEAINALPSAQPESLVKESRTLVKDLVEDTISRQAAIDVCDNAIDLWHGQLGEGIVIAVKKKIEELPSAQPEPQWISVTERLPESKPEDLEYPTVIACCEDGEVMTACYYESTKEWGIGENYDRKINPVAWMPLPEPYRAERRTDG